MADIILTQKIRDPREGQERKWYSPFFITEDGKVHIQGNLNDKDAVNTKNIKNNAITGDKIYSSENDSDDDKRPITKDHIRNGEVTFDKLDSNTIVKSRIGYQINEETGKYEKDDYGQLIPNKLTNLDLGENSVGAKQLQSYEDSEDKSRPINKNNIQNGAIVYGKLYGSNDGENDDALKPVSQNNIQNGAIVYGKLYGSNEGEDEDTLKPISNENIKRQSVSLSKINEPLYQIENKPNSTTDYILHLYPYNHLDNYDIKYKNKFVKWDTDSVLPQN